MDYKTESFSYLHYLATHYEEVIIYSKYTFNDAICIAILFQFSLQNFRKLIYKNGEVVRLGKKMFCSHLNAALFFGIYLWGAVYNNRNVLKLTILFYFCKTLITVHIGHIKVEKNNIRCRCFCTLLLLPASLSASITLLWFSIIFLQIASPIPVPSYSFLPCNRWRVRIFW